MKPNRTIPMWMKVPSYVLLWAAVFTFGALAATFVPSPWYLLASFAIGLLAGSLVYPKVKAYWRFREEERWVYEAFYEDTEYHATMRHDLLYGSDQCR